MSSGGSGAPVEIEQPGRTLRVIYRDDAYGWRASSPDIRRLDERGATLTEVKARTRARLRQWLRSGVHVREYTRHTKVSIARSTPGLVKIDTESSFRLSRQPTRATRVLVVKADHPAAIA